jgi:hypothetical protein
MRAVLSVSPGVDNVRDPALDRWRLHDERPPEAAISGRFGGKCVPAALLLQILDLKGHDKMTLK